MSRSITKKQLFVRNTTASASGLSSPVGASDGGTGVTSYTIGDIIYASGTTTLSKLADVATGNALISGGVGVAPSWGKIGVSTHISGLGTGVATALAINTGGAGAIVTFNGVLGTPSSATLTSATGLPLTTGLTGGNWKTIYTNGSGTIIELALGSSGQVLQSNGASSAPTWVAASSGITAGTTTITSGTDTRVSFNDAGVYGEDADFTWNKTTNVLNIAVTSSTTTGLNFGGGQILRRSGSSIVFGDGIASGDFNTLLGISHGTASGSYNVCVGQRAALDGGSGSSNTIVGRNAGRGMLGGSNNVLLGSCAAGTSFAVSNCLLIGSENNTNWGASVLANEAWIGSEGAGGGYTQFYFGQGKTKASPSTITFNVTGGSGADNAGSNFIIAAGKSTGTASAGAIVFKTSVKGSTGSTAQTLGDSFYIAGKYVDLTESTATAFCRINIPTSTVAGGIVTYTIEANDGTDFQSLTGNCRWDAVNKAGTTTIVITDLQNGTGASSSVSTLTNTLTAVDSGSGNVDFKANATSSLTQTVLRINFQVSKNFGTGSITAS